MAKAIRLLRKQKKDAMKTAILFLIAASMEAQTLATIAESVFSQTQNDVKYSGLIEISPAKGCRLTRDGRSFAFTKRTYCIGTTGGQCDSTTAAGVVSIQLVPTGPGTIPTGCYYTAKYTPLKGDVDTETWVIPAAATYQIKDVRTSIAPSPSAIIRLSQLQDTTGGTGCLEKQSDGTVRPTGVACGTGTGSGGGVTPAGATWQTVIGTYATNNRTWAAQ